MDNNFNNTQIAFSLKSDTELDRAYFLFKLINSQPLVRIGTAVTNFAINAHLPVEKLIRATVFDHFYDAMNMTLKIIDFAKERKALPFAVFKPTGFGRFELYQKIGEKVPFTPQEQAEWDRVAARFDRVCKAAHDKDIALLIDAEESWMQDAADDLVEDMMRKYNKQKPIVFNTLQMYRWDRMDYLKKLHEKAKAEGFYIGMKLVRGAYMEKENLRAEEKGYPTPICASKEASDVNYDAAVLYMAEHLDTMSIFAGTHNEESTYKLMELMKSKGIASNDDRIWFGQLYGMSD